MAREPERVSINGCNLECPICRYDRFWTGRAQLNTALATFFNFDWANKEVDTQTCARCGHVLWFDPDVQ